MSRKDRCRRIEDVATSKKQTELATQQDADQAETRLSKKERMAKKIQKMELRLNNLRDRLAETGSSSESGITTDDSDNETERSIKDVKKEQREQRKLEIKRRRTEKFDRLSPDSKKRFVERRDSLEKEREYRKSLTKDELVAYKLKKKQERQEKKIQRIESMTPEKRECWETTEAKRLAEKKRISEMTAEEFEAFRNRKKEIRAENTAMYKHVREHQTDEIPDDLDVLIVDGNNIRGGGPRRHSRDAILGYVEDTKRVLPILEETEIVVWFDHKPKDYKPIDGIEVNFSGDIIADDRIVDRVDEIRKSGRNVMVITSDRELSHRILKLGGMVMRGGIFSRLNPKPLKNRH